MGDFIIATLRFGENERDIKISAMVSVAQLVSALSEVYEFSAGTFQAEPLGIVLDNNKSLAEQSIETGAVLTAF